MAATDLLIGSLCSGVGGLDLGVQAALGGRIAWHAETDPHAAQVLARHWPSTSTLGDVRTINWSQTSPVCVLAAGFPCQGLSIAGPRTGLTPGTRSGLWHHIADAIGLLSPCLVVIENVHRPALHPRRNPRPSPRRTLPEVFGRPTRSTPDAGTWRASR